MALDFAFRHVAVLELFSRLYSSSRIILSRMFRRYSNFKVGTHEGTSPCD